MFYKLVQDDNGRLRDASGVRHSLIECVAAHTPQGLNVGYTEFPSRSAALAFYGVEEIPEEEMFPMEEAE